MNRSLIVGLLSATMLVSAAAPSLSERLTSNPLQEEQKVVRVMAQHKDAGNGLVHLAQANVERGDRDIGAKRPHDRERADLRGHDREGDRRPDRAGPDGPAHGSLQPGLHLAARLSAAETYVGITSAQLDVWRTYSAALIDLLDHPERDRGPDGPRRERPAGPPPADGAPAQPATAQPANAPFFTERLAALAIKRGEKAETLKTAISALRAALTPEQTGRLLEAERSLLPPPGPDGPRGHVNDRADRPERPRGDAHLPTPPR
jgi:hypothetical protein